MINPLPNYTLGDLRNHDAVGAIIKNQEGKILMFFHKKFNFWTIPIGKAEPGETPYKGICNELAEECGIKVTKATEIATRPYSYIRNGKNVGVVLHLYTIDRFSGMPKSLEQDKHPIMKYMTIQEIKAETDLSDATLLMLETI